MGFATSFIYVLPAYLMFVDMLAPILISFNRLTAIMFPLHYDQVRCYKKKIYFLDMATFYIPPIRSDLFDTDRLHLEYTSQ
jgi:hypothetical protein